MRTAHTSSYIFWTMGLILTVAVLAGTYSFAKDSGYFTASASPLPQYLEEQAGVTDTSAPAAFTGTPEEIRLMAAFDNEFYMPLGSDILYRDSAPAAATNIASNTSDLPGTAPLQCRLGQKHLNGTAVAMNCSGR